MNHSNTVGEVEMKLQAAIERDTRALALPQGRKVGDPGHDAAMRYLEQRLTDLGSNFSSPNCRERHEARGLACWTSGPLFFHQSANGLS